MYYETLSETLEAALGNLAKRKGELSDGVDFHEPFQYGGIPYGTYKSASFALSALRGKPTRKAFHVSIYRMESGRYELTDYVL
jgi:hypothetical protein